MNTHTRAMSAFAATLALAVGGLAYSGTAQADEPCVPTPAIAATPGTPAVPPVTETIPATPSVWQNFSPNEANRPFEGPPSHPVDPRGTWNHEGKEIPPGHAGPDGVYQKGNGNGSWFYRKAGTPEQVIVITPEIPAVPGTPAVPAVECPEVPEVVTPESPAPETPNETEDVVPPTPGEETPVAPETPAEESPEPEVVVEEEEEEDPVVSTVTKSTPHKTVKVHTHESGAVTRDVTVYPVDAVEEGL